MGAFSKRHSSWGCATHQPCYYGNALQAASYKGYKKIVEMLLDKGADANAKGGEYGNVLQAASAGGYEKIVELLLGMGAEFNARG
jgi:ankyrin repeat protein